MRVLVTGASGFVGAALVRRLAGDPGFNVRAASRSRPTQLPPGTEWVRAPDLSSRANWSDLLTGVDVVVHLAARVHVMARADAASEEEYETANVDGTQRLAEQCAAAGVKRFLFLSSVKVHGERGALTEDSACTPTDAYGRSKWRAEQSLRELSARAGLEAVIVRPPLVYGPSAKANMRALLSVVRRRVPLPLASIANRRSLVAVDNLVDLIALCVRHPAAASETFLVSDGEDLSTPELVRRMAAAAGQHARLFPMPVWGLRIGGRLLGQRAMVDRLVDSLYVDISKVRRLLGWSPPVSVDEGLRRLAAQ